ncbi:MAG: GDSL-type esterase/lipase family protein [Polyangiaceae bacterium]
MKPFYLQLAKVQQKTPGAKSRVLFYGDSTIMADWTTGTLRRRLQSRFGDGGHGFVLPVSGWRDYHHDDVTRWNTRLWSVMSVVPGGDDGMYGLGGVAAIALGAGLRATIGTTKHGPVGRTIDRVEVSYLTQSYGGQIEVSLDEQPPQLINTRAEVIEARSLVIETNDAPHRVQLHSMGHGPTRILGVELLRSSGGVIVDSIGLGGARLRALLQINEGHWASELQRRHPSLVVFAFGANERGELFFDERSEFLRTGRDVLARFRKALPDTSCMIVAAYDRAGSDGTTDTDVADLVRAQAKLANEARCAFFNTFEAMGGAGSMARWIARGLGSADRIHPSPAGADLLAGWIYDAWMSDLAELSTDELRTEP